MRNAERTEAEALQREAMAMMLRTLPGGIGDTLTARAVALAVLREGERRNGRGIRALNRRVYEMRHGNAAGSYEAWKALGRAAYAAQCAYAANGRGTVPNAHDSRAYGPDYWAGVRDRNYARAMRHAAVATRTAQDAYWRGDDEVARLFRS